MKSNFLSSSRKRSCGRKVPSGFVADEPELSLHVTWQEKLLKSITALAGRCQVIVATHSPDIAGGFLTKSLISAPMTVGFTRTPSGIVGKWHFYSMPTIWVEGPTDIYFYSPIVDDLQCRIEAFHGHENATALIEGLRDHGLPYLVVLDGDYDILSAWRSPHKRVIRLRRYSFENYLWEREPLNRACHRSAQSGDRTELRAPNLTASRPICTIPFGKS